MKNAVQNKPSEEPLVSESELRVARRLSQLRQESGLTLQEVARKSRLSASYLSRVENGRTAISLANLSILSECFVVPMSFFFEEDGNNPELILTRSGEGKKVRLRGRKGIVVRMLAFGKANRLMEPFIADVSTAGSEMALQSHPGQEMLHVLEGQCDFDHGSQTLRISAGDTLYFDATVPHRVRALPNTACRFLAAVTAGDQRFHADIVKVLEDQNRYLP